MTVAARIVAGLGGRWNGHRAMCRCPAHKDRNPSMSVAVGDNDTALVHCFAGCTQDQVIDALRARGLWESARETRAVQPRRQAVRAPSNQFIESVRRIWAESRPITGTPAELYLLGRRLNPPFPDDLRFHPSVYHKDTERYFPALIAGVRSLWPDEVVAVHRIYLTLAGEKAALPKPKMLLGDLCGGAVRLGPTAEKMAVSEGIETGLAYQQIHGVPTWAAISAGGLLAIALPPEAHTIIAAQDGDAAGRKAMSNAAAVWAAAGHSIEFDDAGEGADWNDLLYA